MTSIWAFVGSGSIDVAALRCKPARRRTDSPRSCAVAPELTSRPLFHGANRYLQCSFVLVGRGKPVVILPLTRTLPNTVRHAAGARSLCPFPLHPRPPPSRGRARRGHSIPPCLLSTRAALGIVGRADRTLGAAGVLPHAPIIFAEIAASAALKFVLPPPISGKTHRKLLGRVPTRLSYRLR
jgi:hypothetical protein